MVADITYGLYDCDQHYYETPDCFSRHIDPKYRDLAVVPIKNDDGTEALACGDRVIAFGVPELFSAAEPPGSLMAVLNHRELSRRSEVKASVPLEPAYVTRTERLKVMDEQGVEATLILPTVGITVEYELVDQPTALTANLRSFNRWLEEEWGYGEDGRIYGVPQLSLVDLDFAVTELERVVGAGARAVYLRPAPVGGRSLADPYFDPFWARVNEIGLPVAFHTSAGLFDQSALYSENPRPGAASMSALQFGFFFCDRPIMDTLGSLILHNLFGRFPRVRVMSIENGASWVPYFMKILYKGWRMAPFGPALGGKLDRKPTDIFREHVWVSPFPEDDNVPLVERIGADRVLFGSDFPHAEGVEAPIDFAKTLPGVSDSDLRKIMRDNLRTLLDRP